jgi:Fe-S-cluster-containing dehydrogenase component
MNGDFELMMKCDMCYDRTSVGKQPMCTTVCPSRALHFGTREEVEAMRPRSQPGNRFVFGRQEVHTKVFLMMPRDARVEYLDVLTAMDDRGHAESLAFPILSDADVMLDNLYRDAEGA